MHVDSGLLPAFLLDFLFTFNIVVGLVIIMIAINSSKPLDFSAFPAILLIANAVIGLNVASTRLVLVKGHEGPDAAGKVIEASFGEFVIAGNYLVVLSSSLILMIGLPYRCYQRC